MRPTFIFFVIVVILGFLAGYYSHATINEQIIYEREQCFNNLISPLNLSLNYQDLKYDFDMNLSEVVQGEKVQYERDTCYELMETQKIHDGIFTNIPNISEAISNDKKE